MRYALVKYNELQFYFIVSLNRSFSYMNSYTFPLFQSPVLLKIHFYCCLPVGAISACLRCPEHFNKLHSSTYYTTLVQCLNISVVVPHLGNCNLKYFYPMFPVKSVNPFKSNDT